MTDRELAELLCRALPPTASETPSRDLWPDILERTRARTEWSWLDLTVAALVVVTLAIAPEWVWFLAYQL